MFTDYSVDSNSDMLFVIDQNQLINDINDVALEALGASWEACAGKSICEVLSRKDAYVELACRLEEVIRNTLGCGQSKATEVVNGAFRYLCLINPVPGQDGSISKAFVVVKEHGLMIFEKTNSKEHLFSGFLLDYLPEPAVIVDSTGILIMWNKHMREKILGRSERDMQDCNILDAVYWEDRNVLRETLKDIFQEGNTQHIDTRLLVCGGPKLYWKRFYGKSFDAGDSQYALIIGVDVDPRMMCEQAVTDTLVLWTDILMVWNIGLFELDIENGNVLQSAEHARIFGYETIGQDWTISKFLEHVVDEDRDRVGQLVIDGMDSKCRTLFDCRIRKADGEIRWIKVAASPKIDQSGNPFRLHGFVEDITDLRASLMERRSSEENIEDLRKMEFVGQIAGMVTHDINNVLNAIMANTEVLLDMLGEDWLYAEYLSSIKYSVASSSEMLRNLLTSLRNGRYGHESKTIDLNSEIKKLYPLLRSAIKRDIELILDLSEKPLLVSMAPFQLLQVVINLCINARDSIAGHGTIMISTKEVGMLAEIERFFPEDTEGEIVELVISDTGCGIDSKLLSDIFQPYYSTKDIGNRGGLGLASVNTIVTQNHGYIKCSSCIGVGTAFSIYFQCRQDLQEGFEE